MTPEHRSALQERLARNPGIILETLAEAAGEKPRADTLYRDEFLLKRPLLQALTAHIPVRWTAGPRSVPAWLGGTGVTVARAPAHAPGISAASAATAYHEAIEAMRWARSLLASGIPASEIAIATASPADYDDHFLALRADANIDLHFIHGIRTVATREGQAAAALADLVDRDRKSVV